jgi:hypothetical protein
VEGRSLAAYELDTVKSDLGRVVEVVNDDDIIAGIEESQRREGANVARTTIPITMLVKTIVPLSAIAIFKTSERSRQIIQCSTDIVLQELSDLPGDEDSPYRHCGQMRIIFGARIQLLVIV